MKTYTAALPPANQVQGSGSPVDDMNKVRDALTEIRSSVPNAASEVNAAPATLLDSNTKIKDTSLASTFVKTVNSLTPDSNGNVSVTISGTVNTTGDQSISGTKTFSTAPLSGSDGTTSNSLVRKSQLDTKAESSIVVLVSLDQTIAGVKTFSSPPVSSNAATTSNQLVRKNELDLKADATSLASKANSSDVVLLTGAQTISNTKTFNVPPVSATTATTDSQLVNLGQVRTLVGSGGVSITVRSVTDSYTLVSGDANNIIEVSNTGGTTITVPANSSVGFAVGTTIEIVQMNTGQVTVAGASGVTLQTPATLATRTRYASIVLRKRDTETWIIGGDLA